MAEWFNERYISREEHQQIVEYYRKLVASLQHSLCTLHQAEARVADIVVEDDRPQPTPPLRARQASVSDNVIRVDFHRRK
jgi:hypothetical protein